MIMVAMSYFCRQNVSQISLKIVVNCSHPSEILALKAKVYESWFTAQKSLVRRTDGLDMIISVD